MKNILLSFVCSVLFITLGNAQPVNKLFFADFESPEYNLGPIAGQNGWTEFVSDLGSGVIANSNPYNGAQSLMITADGIPSGQLSGPFSPNLGSGLYSSGFASMSAWVSIEPGMNGVIFELAPQTPSEGFLITRVRFNPDLSIDVLDPGGFVPTGASAPMGYFYLVVNINRITQELQLFINGSMIYQGMTAATATDIEQVVIFITEDPTSIGSNIYVDDLCIADGFINPDPNFEPIPTLSQWGTISLALILLIVGRVSIMSGKREHSPLYG